MNEQLRGFLRRLTRPIERARDDVVRRSAARPDHHWAFDRFRPYSGPVDEGVFLGFIGDKSRAEYCDWGYPPARHETLGLPPIDEEYFEWTDILEAALAARGTFTFLELGAGWGRWSARAALAARQLGKKVKLGLAEGDPKHVDFIRTNMADNGVPASDYRIFETAVSGSAGETVYCIANPAEDGNWYGQGMVGGVIGDHPRVGEYYGRPMFEFGAGGARVIMIPQVPLSNILSKYEFIDLADLDLQTGEREAVPEAIDALNAKVRRLHIGTHAPDIEASLREVLSNAEWVCLRDYPGNQTNQTAFGPCYFVDGVQTWINPRHA